MFEALVPPHLRRFVVRQDYDAYTEQDHAIWRFVVMQTHARLLTTGHAAYAAGFDKAGITVERIPRITEMSERLSQSGWRAVAVDGFIPPRAFHAFQARGILPIAADIRTAKHLTYTPAPDIIHEAAGHAPFLTEPAYAEYVKKIGRAAERVFAGPADRELYLAIHVLSEVKENPSSTAAQIARAEDGLARAVKSASSLPASESAKLARLYWWTAEYGLVGTLTNFRLYGAGLLSSIGEGHFCRRDSVQKLPLTAECVNVDYDITRAQPQLFVAESLLSLSGVLDDVTRSFASERGGDVALSAALSSDDAATLELDSGTALTGEVRAVHRAGDTPFCVELRGECALSDHFVVRADLPRTQGYALPLGTLDDGTPLSSLTPAAFTKRTDENGRFTLVLASGLRIRGRARRFLPDGRPRIILVEDFELARNGQVLFRSEQLYPLALAHFVRTASAAVPDGFFAETPTSDVSVPRPREFGARDRELSELYERAMEAWREFGGSSVENEFRRIVDRLEEHFPEDWLLRWNLLESLVKLGRSSSVTSRLEADLERLEIRFDHLEPIATGLSHVRAMMRSSPAHGERP
jgi:phenylalanine-4-hydroxylase